jgi:flavin-dependent dehydrogenase
MVTQVLIAGGGLAGSAGAILLGRAGMSAHLLEREKGPCDKMCGEFLSIEAQQHLRLLEMNCMALGAVPIDRARIVHGATVIEAALPFVALGLSRKRLDEALLEQSARAGAHVERGVRVREIVGHDVLTTAGVRTADHVFLATGKHDVRGTERPDARRSDYVAFKMHWKLATAQREALGGAIELIVFDGGYAGLQCVEGGVANLCLVIRRGVLASTGKRWADTSCASLT